MSDEAIDEILKQHWFDYIDAEHKVKGNNGDRLRYANEEAAKSIQAEIQKQVTLGKIEELEQVLESCDNLGGDIRYSDVDKRLAALQAELQGKVK